MALHTAFDTPHSKRTHVRKLFATIADRYDLITRLLSYGQDAKWKAALVSIAEVRRGERALDLAAGTGDIAFAVAARGARTIALDITHRMLQLASRKSSTASFITGDMGSLPFSSAAFDLVTTGYGLRNVPDLDVAIDEIARVLKPGGRLLSLDFNKPEHALVRGPYLLYLSAAGSILGWLLHRDADTYRYIPESIKRYPGARGVADRLAARGFDSVTVIPCLFGLMSIHVARRSDR
ncbi:MAG TPA: ubiquinone/menaquinone biosynthesis methyltransferase [Vicinamibacterales bacterium]|nr:ubiquinone/menaquinone biosynthesis methyltransferase [Vicinamibacterales bacterium]